MKLVSFVLDGVPSYGLVKGDKVADLKPLYGAVAPDLKTLIASGLLERVASEAFVLEATLPMEQLTLLPVIPNPGKIVCLGLNYHDHVQETGRTVTESPALFLRVAESQVAHGQAIVRPRESTSLDYEGEIALVIGRPGRRIAEADAWDHVAGYSCYNDGSVRDWQRASSQWTAGKNFWRTGGFGPWLVTSDEIRPGQQLTLVTRLNGVEVQRATSDMLIHSIPRQIAFISTVFPLEAGDVIVTGTPGGIGSKRVPPLFMKPGDVVEVEVDAVGTLRNTIQDE